MPLPYWKKKTFCHLPKYFRVGWSVRLMEVDRTRVPPLFTQTAGAWPGPTHSPQPRLSSHQHTQKDKDKDNKDREEDKDKKTTGPASPQKNHTQIVFSPTSSRHTQEQFQRRRTYKVALELTLWTSEECHLVTEVVNNEPVNINLLFLPPKSFFFMGYFIKTTGPPSPM